MKNIEEYILEKEYSENYELIEEGFFSWLSKIGKKFWNWLVGKDFDDDNTNWKTDKKLKWVKGDNNVLSKFYDKESLREHFPQSYEIYDKSKNYPLKSLTATNKDGTPIIQILFIPFKKNELNKLVSALSRRYNIRPEEENKILSLDNAVLVLCVNIAEKNDERNDDIWDEYIQKQLDILCDEADMVFFDERGIPRDIRRWLDNDAMYHGNSKKNSTDIIMLNGVKTWSKLDGSKQKEETKPEPEQKQKEETKPDQKQKEETKPEQKQKEETEPEQKQKEETKPEPEQQSSEPAEDNKDVFTVDDLTFKYNNDNETIKNILGDDYDESSKYLLITDIIDNDSSISMGDLKKIITGEKFNTAVKKLLKINKDTSVIVCFKIEKDKDHKPIINSLDNMSTAGDGDVHFDITDVDNGVFALEIDKLLKESLDIDNIFWMLDTWFSNNEQERTTFMSIIDNCIIKKSYNKNDLAKLCDNINFNIRPFVNFMCKDAVVADGQKEDFNIDYYYELKKIIDALISNKSTSNKFVRFS